MPILLLIDTGSSLCSVAISADDKIAARYEINNNNHAAYITTGIEYCVASSNISLNDIDAVAINGGPGSYTGLRIGLSVAKGICYTLGKPLIMIDALQILAAGMHRTMECKFYCSIVDNRHNEVFYALYDENVKCLINTTLSHVDDVRMYDMINQIIRTEDSVAFAGSGAQKLKKCYSEINIAEISLIAEDIMWCALKKYACKDFSNVAYSEPFYHKAVYISSAKV